MKNLILFLMFGTPFILYSYCKESIFSYEQYLECYSSKIQSNNIIAHTLYKKLDLYDNIKVQHYRKLFNKNWS